MTKVEPPQLPKEPRKLKLHKAKLNEQSDTRPHRLLEAIRTMAEPTVKAALCHDAYDEIRLRAPSKARGRHIKTVAAMPRASMCIIGRCMTTWIGITRPNLVKTTERLVGTIGRQVKLDGVVFLNVTLRDATTSQLVYVTP